MIADKVLETTDTTGTGTYALNGSPSGFVTFILAFTTGKPCFYICTNAAATIWEIGYGVITAGSPATLTHNLIRSSTGSLISWGAGTKTIYNYSIGAALGLLLVGNAGSARPGWLQKWGRWIKSDASPRVAYLFDGTSDLPYADIDDSAHSYSFRAYSEDAGATEGPYAELDRNSASAAANDLVGVAQWAIRSATGVKRIAAKVIGKIVTATNGAEDLALLVQTIIGGTLATVLTITKGLQIGAPTGGDVANAVNAQAGFYDNGVRIGMAGINSQADSYTLVLADAGKLVEMTKATANNLTVPLNSSVAFPVNTAIDVVQNGAGQVTIVAAGGVTIRSTGGKLKLYGQYSAATLLKRGTDEWYLLGDLVA